MCVPWNLLCATIERFRVTYIIRVRELIIIIIKIYINVEIFACACIVNRTDT